MKDLFEQLDSVFKDVFGAPPKPEEPRKGEVENKDEDLHREADQKGS